MFRARGAASFLEQAAGLERGARGGVEQLVAGAQLPQQEGRVAGATSAECVDELLVGAGLLAFGPQLWQPYECVLLLCGGLHLLVGPVEVVEVLGGAVGGSICGRLLEDHCLVQPVDGPDVLAGLDASQQPQCPGAVSPGADAEPVEQPLREFSVGVRDEHRRPAGRQGPLVELGRGERFEFAQVKTPVEGRHFHCDVLERDSAARYVEGA